jgi:hypothetical protein
MALTTVQGQMLTAPLTLTGNLTFSDSSVQTAAASPYVLKNRLINGAMVIDQRNAGASVGTASGTGAYTVDRWQITYDQTNKFTAQQNAGSVTPPAGYINYLGITSSSAYTVGSSEQFAVRQFIEGFNTADLGWGTSSAQTVTLSFWVRSSLTGTFGGVIGGYVNTNSYPFTYTISSANTWEQKTITITGATSGTWNTGNSGGIGIIFGLGVGSTLSGTAGSWSASRFWSATGATSVVGTNGATFYITGVQLEQNTSATPFERRLYDKELISCQRYYQTTNNFLGPGTTSSSINGMVIAPVTMRTTPSLGLTGVYSMSDYYVADATQSSTGITLFNATFTAAAISLTNFSGITIGRIYLSRMSNSNLITMSAEL